MGVPQAMRDELWGPEIYISGAWVNLRGVVHTGGIKPLFAFRWFVLDDNVVGGVDRTTIVYIVQIMRGRVYDKSSQGLFSGLRHSNIYLV